MRTFRILTLAIALTSAGCESTPGIIGTGPGSGGSKAGAPVSGAGATGTGGAGAVPSVSPGGSGGTSGTGSAAGLPLACENGVVRSGEDDRVTGVALEASSLAPPERAVSIVISLVDPYFDFERLQSPGSEEASEAIIAERRAQLATTQDPIEERLLARGGEVLSRDWLVNVMDARVAARYVNEVPCWPAVVHIELSSEYWDIVDPPWDSEAVGSEACPLEGDACTAHCVPIHAACLDPDMGCSKPREIAACSRKEHAFYDSVPSCSVRTETGELCAFGSNVALAEPAYAGFAPCSEEERHLALSAVPCGM
ncbi:MAG TPA: hypothetical protein VF103_08290 [Polyangiaceae bacterium]